MTTIDITANYACHVPYSLRDLGKVVGTSTVQGIEDQSRSSTYRFEVSDVKTVSYTLVDVNGNPITEKHVADLYRIGELWWYLGPCGWREWTGPLEDGGMAYASNDYYQGTGSLRWFTLRMGVVSGSL